MAADFLPGPTPITTRFTCGVLTGFICGIFILLPPSNDLVSELFVHAVISVPSHRHVQDSYLRNLCVDSISGLKPPSPVLSCRSGRRSREKKVARLKGDEVANDA